MNKFRSNPKETQNKKPLLYPMNNQQKELIHFKQKVSITIEFATFYDIDILTLIHKLLHSLSRSNKNCSKNNFLLHKKALKKFLI